MANYYTRETVIEPLKLTDLMISVLQCRDAEVDVADDANVLDGILAGQMVHESTVVFENGWREEDPEELIAEHDPYIEDEDKAEFDRLLALEKAAFFREALKVNPDTNWIQLQAGWSCSKMRLDGFGGSSLHVSREGYMYVSTTDVQMDEHGQFICGAEFVTWKEHNVRYPEAA